MKILSPFHPYLFAIFPLLFLWSHNIDEVSIYNVIRPLFIILLIIFLLRFLLNYIIKDKNKTGLIISIFALFFFSYGHLFDAFFFLQNTAYGFLFRHRYIFPLWNLIILITLIKILRLKSDMYNLTKILNFVSLILVLISAINILVYELKTKNIRDQIKSSIIEDTLEEPAEYRDIYYIILDGYAASSTLNNIYRFENREFTDFMEKEGFFVASKSVSNYGSTQLSLASSLNMEYVKVDYSKDQRTLVQKMSNNKVQRLLKSKGYKTIYFCYDQINEYADIVYKEGKWNAIEMMLFRTSMLKPFSIYLLAVDIRAMVLNVFDKLEQMPEIKGNKFVIAHIMCPHPPFVFEKDGAPAPFSIIGNSMFNIYAKEAYLNQIMFLNNRTKQLIKQIISKSKIQPIIVIQADHGPTAAWYDISKVNDEVLVSDIEGVKRNMRILNAYYLPSGGDKYLYDSITPVNTFRIIFNYYFHANYELLKDRSYFCRGEDYVNFKFNDVTDIVGYK